MEQKEIIAKSIDQICDMILACDQTGRIIYMNETAQKQLEYPVSDPSISIFDIFPGIFTEAKDLAETRQRPRLIVCRWISIDTTGPVFRCGCTF